MNNEKQVYTDVYCYECGVCRHILETRRINGLTLCHNCAEIISPIE